MADNINITPGSGKTIAADDVSGVLYPRNKVSIGVDGSATDLAFGQTTSANSLPIVIASDQSAISTKDAGPSQTLTRTYTTSANMSTAAAITPSPTTGQKIVAMDILVSTDTAMNFSVQMETSNNVLAKIYMPANSSAQITLRGGLKGDVADKKLFGKASVSGNVAITAVTFSEA
jgi:hypothetical protein